MEGYNDKPRKPLKGQSEPKLCSMGPSGAIVLPLFRLGLAIK